MNDHLMYIFCLLFSNSLHYESVGSDVSVETSLLSLKCLMARKTATSLNIKDYQSWRCQIINFQAVLNFTSLASAVVFFYSNFVWHLIPSLDDIWIKIGNKCLQAQ